MVNLKRSGEIVMTDKGYVFENALGNLSFAIPNGKSTEWVSASKILSKERGSERITATVHGNAIKTSGRIGKPDWKT